MWGKIMRNGILLMLLSFALVGCSTEYGCGMFPRTGCRPVGHVYNETNGEIYDYRKSYIPDDVSGNGVATETSGEGDAGEGGGTSTKNMPKVSVSGKTLNYISPGDAILTAPKELRVLVTPWEDEDRDLNAGGYIYIRLGEPEWRILK